MLGAYCFPSSSLLVEMSRNDHQRILTISLPRDATKALNDAGVIYLHGWNRMRIAKFVSFAVHVSVRRHTSLVIQAVLIAIRSAESISRVLDDQLFRLVADDRFPATGGEHQGD